MSAGANERDLVLERARHPFVLGRRGLHIGLQLGLVVALSAEGEGEQPFAVDLPTATVFGSFDAY